ncbi:MAG TPA: PhzF family phenazine biosynthesis protein [Candidatus Sulfotelmatobacter sp.]|jgi:PhzF family phenazine biosynthesis protein
MRIPVFHVDAFTKHPFRGNPAAVCLLNAWLDDEMLRKVAAENNLSETAFLVPIRNLPTHDLPGSRAAISHYDLRWFSPRKEVKLCGHATLASAYVVCDLWTPGIEAIRFETRWSGTLTVRKDGNLFSMDFPALFPKSLAHRPNSHLSALGPDRQLSDVLEVNETYIVVYEKEDAIQHMRPDFAGLEQLHPFVVAVTAPGDNVDFVSRYFKPSYGLAEDPVTGSVHCALTPYWSERLGKSRLHARQLSERGGELWCETGPEKDRVILQGDAVLTMEGSLII